MMRHYYTALLIALFVGTAWQANGQTDCSQALIQAERAYYTGKFNEVETLLVGCIANGFGKEQKTEAYKLIALSKIFSRNFDQADSALILMLKNNPQYEFAAQDPPEFKKRVENFKVHPLIEVSFNLGLVQPNFKVDKVYDTQVGSVTTTMKGKAGVHTGLSVSYYFNKEISVRAGYELQKYSFTVNDQNDLNTALLTENQTRTQWQAAAGYTFRLKKISLQAYAGFVYSTLRTADSYLVMDRVNASGEIEFSYSNLEQRTKNEFRPLLEMKLNIPQKNNWLLSFNVRYEIGLSNMTNAENRYSSLERAVVFEWVEDDFKGRYLSASIGVSKLFYKVKLK